MNDHFLFQDNSAYNYLETEMHDDKKPSSSNIYAISKYKSSSSSHVQVLILVQQIFFKLNFFNQNLVWRNFFSMFQKKFNLIFQRNKNFENVQNIAYPVFFFTEPVYQLTIIIYFKGRAQSLEEGVHRFSLYITVI